MGIFATLVRRGAQAEVGAYAAPVGEAPQALPARFEAVGDRLLAGHDVSAACAVVGREIARDGADLGEALDGLHTTYARVLGGEPGFRAVRALCEAWSEETLGYVHQISCENPLTGLASLAHLRARLAEVYRGGEQGEVSASTSHALVVLDLPLLGRTTNPHGDGAGGDPFASFDSTLWLVRLAESARLAFPGAETIAQTSPSRLVVVARRGELLARRVRLLRDLVDDLGAAPGWARVWVEGLPPTDHAVGFLLDEIARS